MPLAFYYTDSLCIYVSPKFQYSLLGLEILFIYISFNFWKPLVLQAAIRQYGQADATEPYSMYSAAGVQGLTSLVMAARAYRAGRGETASQCCRINATRRSHIRSYQQQLD